MNFKVYLESNKFFSLILLCNDYYAKTATLKTENCIAINVQTSIKILAKIKKVYGQGTQSLQLTFTTLNGISDSKQKAFVFIL